MIFMFRVATAFLISGLLWLSDRAESRTTPFERKNVTVLENASAVHDPFKLVNGMICIYSP
jgi:hypothetical protein